ncbi:MAG: hypothetical protein A3J58_00820 [Candidatus Sungbacteria bacterium RIFCSPHIGHO2_02_FULL_52_23]|uniref:Dipeptidylpeptidase IV N-terminal domain-containing protein n=1 Tax=Candidatus Sungbacteria bacterium RIFCSPHIGHO2_02_FULL_52_23 TaxID=1802274 RepID=A0A1G2L0Q4_9BACT|nr:MAG: hypothetical protein A3J58_00820 [Candidatus Sungbacteria bacterium RIFCSPHIGHO2_02_FULL_52_23]
MNLSRKKLLIYLGLGLLVMGVIGFFIWRSIRPAPPAIPAGGGGGVSGGMIPYPEDVPSPPTGGLPGATSTPESQAVPGRPAARLIRITDFPVVSPSLNRDETKILFYKKDGGDMFSADLNGASQKKISNLTILGLMEAVWSPARDRAAILYLDGNTVKSFLHIGTSSVAVLPSDITSASWSPDGKSLAYTRREGDLLALSIADSGGRAPRTVLRVPVPDARIAWADADRVTFITPASGLAEGYIFSHSRRAGTFQKIAGPTFGLMATWSPFSARAVLSSTAEGGVGMTTKVLNPFDPDRKDQVQLDIATFAEKCVFVAVQELWCAEPRSLESMAPLPDLYLTGEYNSSDRIVRIDLIKNTVEDILNQDNFDAVNLTLTKDKNYLFFVNRHDGTLWSLKLK